MNSIFGKTFDNYIFSNNMLAIADISSSCGKHSSFGCNQEMYKMVRWPTEGKEREWKEEEKENQGKYCDSKINFLSRKCPYT